MTCRECSDSLEQYLRGPMAEPERSRVADHLSGCPDCRHMATVERRLLALAARPAPTSPESRAAWWAEAQEQLRRERPEARLARNLRLRRAQAAAFVFSMLVEPLLGAGEQTDAALRQAGEAVVRPLRHAGGTARAAVEGGRRLVVSPVGNARRLLQDCFGPWVQAGPAR